MMYFTCTLYIYITICLSMVKATSLEDEGEQSHPVNCERSHKVEERISHPENHVKENNEKHVTFDILSPVNDKHSDMEPSNILDRSTDNEISDPFFDDNSEGK